MRTDRDDPELEEMMDEVSDEFQYSGREERRGFSRLGAAGGSLLKPILIAVAGLILLIVVLLFLGSRGGQGIRLEEKVASLEERIARLELQPTEGAADEQRFAKLEQNQTANENTLAELARRQGDLSTHVQSLAREVESLSRKSSQPAPPQPASRPAAVEKPRQPSGAASYTVQQGDTLYRIGMNHGVSVEKLRELNGLSPQDVILPGQKLRVK